MAKTSKQAGLRKLPTQARSQARVANILKATGALLGEVGYADLTTNLIAERAKIPVGSIYQFFDGKDDIVAALVEQFRERISRSRASLVRRARGATAVPLSPGSSTASPRSRPTPRRLSACFPPTRRKHASTISPANCDRR